MNDLIKLYKQHATRSKLGVGATREDEIAERGKQPVVFAVTAAASATQLIHESRPQLGAHV